MEAFKSLVQPLVGGAGGSSVIDGMKLVVLGGTVETARRMSSSAWSHFVNSFFLTAHFSEADYPYDWLMLWLSRRPEWQRSREFETTTRTSTIGMPGTTDFSFGDEDLEGASAADDELMPGKMKTRVLFQPTFDTTHTIYYRGHLLRVKRGRKNDGSMTELLSISVVARNNSILKQLVLQAKKEYEAEAIHRIQIYFADSYGSWRWSGSRHKRPMSSIVLNKGVKEMLLADTRDFLKSEKWYAERGIPFRRGYLLHGVPGSGKSSLIHAIAGELMLDIYVVSLSSSWMNDSILQTLMGRVPARCILLLEDLDAAFTRSVSRDKNSTGSPDGKSAEEQTRQTTTTTSSSSRHRRHRNTEQLSEVNTLSLSGLLNALDGIAAAEGRLLFATTNHLERLDPALSRPGRMDVWIEFKNASKWQAEALFRNFFPSIEDINQSDNDIVLDARELEGIEIPTSPPMSGASSSPATASSSGPTSPTSTGLSSLWSTSPISSTFSVSSVSSASGSAIKPKAPVSVTIPEPHREDDFGSKNQGYIPPPVEDHIANAHHSARPLDAASLGRLATKFADAIPDEEFSVAALQGYLLKNKSQPEAAASEAAQWVVSEREMKERLKREREEKQLKEKLENEKRKQDVIDKERQKKELEGKEAELAKLKQRLEEATSAGSASSQASIKAQEKDIADVTAAIEKQKAEQEAKAKTDEDDSEGSDDENTPPEDSQTDSKEESAEKEQEDSEGWGTLV